MNVSVTFEQIQEAFAQNAKQVVGLYDLLHEAERQRDELAAALGQAKRLVEQAYEAVNDGSMQSSQWQAFKTICSAVSNLNQSAFPAILAERDAALLELNEQGILALIECTTLAHQKYSRMGAAILRRDAALVKPLVEALEDIIGIASGEDQVAADDTQGAEIIDKIARAALAPYRKVTP
jgi:hypothetical protein